MSPRISIIMPTHNRSAAILPSIASVLRQSLSDWQLLVVDDASTDDTVDIVRAIGDARIVLLRTGPNRHPSVGRNLGLEHADAPLVTYLDHDDFFDDHHLEEIVARSCSSTGDVWAFGCRYVDGDRAELARSTVLDGWWTPELQTLGPIFEPSRVAHRRGVVSSVGGWRSENWGLEDWDLWLRLADAGHRIESDPSPAVDIARSGPSRLMSVHPRYFVPIVHADDELIAHEAVEAIASGRWSWRLGRAAALDVRRWFVDSLDDPMTWCHPDLDLESLDEIVAADEDSMTSRVFLVRETRDGPSIGLALSCVRSSTAHRAHRVIQRRWPSVIEALGEIIHQSATERLQEVST